VEETETAIALLAEARAEASSLHGATKPKRPSCPSEATLPRR
jgi:hypothetical protein